MAGTAAIFDLDRTLLRTSSTPALNQARFEPGVARRAAQPGQALMMRIYDVFGQSLPSMEARLRRIPSAQELATTLAPGQRAVP